MNNIANPVIIRFILHIDSSIILNIYEAIVSVHSNSRLKYKYLNWSFNLPPSTGFFQSQDNKTQNCFISE